MCCRSSAELGRDRVDERFGFWIARAGFLAFGGDPLRGRPDRLSVAPPVERKGPAREGFARIPFALPIMQEAARREALAQAPDEPVGEPPLHRADRLGVPFVRLEVVDRDEGGLAAHGEAHVVGDEEPVDLLPQSVERRPGLFRERLGDARMLGDPLDPHVEREFDLGEARQPRDRHGVAVVGGGGERNVAFAGEETRGRIEPDPPGAWKIDLRPGMKIGEVVVGPRRPSSATRSGLSWIR